MVTGIKLRIFRKRRTDFSIKEMASKLDMDENRYARLERGETKIKEEDLEVFLTTFDITRVYLDGIEETTNEDHKVYNSVVQPIVLQNNVDSENNSNIMLMNTMLDNLTTATQQQTKTLAKLYKLLNKK